MQCTVKDRLTISGTGLHTGRHVCCSIMPAAVDYGIVFRRMDHDAGSGDVPARWDCVVDTCLSTVIANQDNVRVGTIEHLMAALRAFGIDNALITLDGPEVPVLDGSARDFCDALSSVGRAVQNAPRRAIKILQPVCVSAPGRSVMLRPAAGAQYRADIDFNHPAIGMQSFSLDLSDGCFDTDIADARTFGFLDEVNKLQQQGLALGGSLDNAIVLNESGVCNPEGLRHPDEFARHKVLDAIGDLYTAGGMIIGAYHGNCAGHALNNALLRELFASPEAWQWVDLYSDIEIPHYKQRLVISGERAVAFA